MTQTRKQDISTDTQTGAAPANEAAALPVRPGRAFGGVLLPKKCLLLAVTALGGLLTAVTPSFAQSIYTPYIFTTLFGVGPGSADGTGSAARFSNSFGLAVDGAGNLYVADSNNNTIRKGYSGARDYVLQARFRLQRRGVRFHADGAVGAVGNC